MSEIKILEYPCVIRSLSKEEGGGYLIEYPDLPGCMSDGETALEAVENGRDAVQAWLAAARETNRHIPKPGEFENQSGKWVQRVPKSVHFELVCRAKDEGVSLNTLVVTMIVEALSRHAAYIPSKNVIAKLYEAISRHITAEEVPLVRPFLKKESKQHLQGSKKGGRKEHSSSTRT